ncbi:hypothetical protein QT196_38685 (plasmid) [Streptomyces sp. P9-2B-2]|uniref:hypothetical protein n=1 Tax=Streptomyces sp. P9-2B-2 TaxID=3057114 RepID=UPI0025B2AA33|nr:hypothetical protein [Streptomyces sp. P9-2B-2]WJY43195.1 hypothetical protein QT196_38685 [Streptomyces sp. P9-2B-2]
MAATIKQIRNGTEHYLTMVHQSDPPYSRVVKPSKDHEPVDDWIWVPKKGDGWGALCVHTNLGVAFMEVDTSTSPQTLSVTWEDGVEAKPQTLPLRRDEEPIRLEIHEDGTLDATRLP